ncbi:hypothetical protein [Thermus scotoductus]|uniref:Uncharacterized protein n=1 Tax=Thermus scotoductus (strain ATCC 700910 / SA-01) TaxID=743525 RepID=E8PL00_THESS|nr:hypothetical protein [Thermus scotoductus]ADW22224.1 hypothetical protein TSC_c16090 [Thermus scotoductus SA-01]
MNYTAHSTLILGKPALKRLGALLKLMTDPEDLLRWARGELTEYLLVSFHQGYAVLENLPAEGEATEIARLTHGFALEIGPDSGGAGWVCDGKKTVSLDPFNLHKAAKLLERWKKNTPPIASSNKEAEKTLRKLLADK